MKLLTIILSICLSANLAFAQKTGNGGDGVVENGKVSLLDLVEPGYEIFFPFKEPILSIAREKMRFFVYRLKTPLSAQEKTWIFTQEDLEDIKDEGVIRYKGTGSLKQLAIQKDNIIVINKPLFEKLDDKGKAALVVHEIIISSALDHGYDLTSEVGTGPIREVVNLLFTDNFMSASSAFYENLWKKLPVKANSPVALGLNRVITRDSYFSKDNQVTYTIKEPRVRIGSNLYKVSSLRNQYDLCEHIGFVTAFYSPNYKYLSADEQTAHVFSSAVDGIELVQSRLGSPYVDEQICGL